MFSVPLRCAFAIAPPKAISDRASQSANSAWARSTSSSFLRSFLIFPGSGSNNPKLAFMGWKCFGSASARYRYKPPSMVVDGGTASAAEVVAAALQDRNRAVVVGSRTFGKGSVQEPIELPDGSAIEFTIGRYLTPNGRVIDGEGVEPDVLIDVASAPEIAEQRALEVLRGLTVALPPLDQG